MEVSVLKVGPYSQFNIHVLKTVNSKELASYQYYFFKKKFVTSSQWFFFFFELEIFIKKTERITKEKTKEPPP